ncbi:MAG: ATP-binding protein [Sulfuricurvum sp.]|nr:ATP-binding protein [Sulfuricurvum sp.]
MFISVKQAQALDAIVKTFEVAFRSFIVDTLKNNYQTEIELKNALNAITCPSEVIYSRKINSKIAQLVSNMHGTFKTVSDCNNAYLNKSYGNDVPFVSVLVDFVLIFFNTIFSNKHLTDGFNSVEDFHYSCFLYHQTRNDLSHPASYPIDNSVSYKVIYFIEQLTNTLNQNYFWYQSKETIFELIDNFYKIESNNIIKISNLDRVQFIHKKLLCRENEINLLSNALLGDEKRKRLAGSVSLYGYGGVGKTAITLDFLFRILREKSDGLHDDIEFILFFTSKEEYLSVENTTGNLYVNKVTAEFSTLVDLQNLILKSLSLDNIDDIERKFSRGIIVIDNIETIKADEKERIFDFIKYLPRSIQFIITSRTEELCDEKIHVEEFRNIEIGKKFITEYLEHEDIYLDLADIDKEKLLDLSKGNALIILQLINILHLKKGTLSTLTVSLESLKNKNAEMIANFMYKNTFTEVLESLEAKHLPAKKAIQIISLYDEPIELYSISKLIKSDVPAAEEICNYFTQRLILNKEGEYYVLNEFAKRFIFIKMLPDMIELQKIKDAISQHKARMKETLDRLDSTINSNDNIHKILSQWLPQNYIDKIVIAELLVLYGKAKLCADNDDKLAYDKCEQELLEHTLITSHPYIPFQQARVLNIGYQKFYKNDTDRLKRIEDSYEMAIESIEFNHRYLLNNNSYPSLLMLFGIFLYKDKADYSRTIRFMEQSKKLLQNEKTKNWFTCASYLVNSYMKMYVKTNDITYKNHSEKNINEIYQNRHLMSYDLSRQSHIRKILKDGERLFGQTK